MLDQRDFVAAKKHRSTNICHVFLPSKAKAYRMAKNVGLMSNHYAGRHVRSDNKLQNMLVIYKPVQLCT
jgi:hypothetical protein